MELRKAPASPPPAPLKNFRLDSAAASPYATAPCSPHGRLQGTSSFAARDEPFSTAPPSPNPFDLFQHFTSAPASPRRAAAIYAHFAEVGSRRDDGEGHQDDESGDEEEFQPRGSYATSVPFDWEERPGTPKAGLGGGGATGAAWDDTADFEFGTVVDKSAPAQELTAADELFEKGRIRPLKKPLLRQAADEPAAAEKGRIRPLKPPPGLLDSGSVASSPRSPMARGGMWSPRLRSRVGSGTDFDPFTAALLEATKAPSPLGGKEANPERDAASSGSPPKKAPSSSRPAASRSDGWRWRRLSDLLLFRSSSDAFRVNKDVPTFKPSPAAQRQPDTTPVKKKTIAQATATTGNKARGNNGYYDMSINKARKQGNNKSAAAAAEGVAGCARLSPLQRLAKGIGAYSWHHHGRGMATAPGTKG